jgi:LmbE family N-acetylglucosaminyl deacetylase
MTLASSGSVAMAIGAHPDDIEFTMAGTLLLLKQAGMDIHMWNLANGNCGTAVHAREEIARLRSAEVQASARVAGATIHPPIADDLAIFYEPSLLAQVAAVLREVKPAILLIPSPQDYMEDHANTCRLAVTGAFARGMRNFATQPPVLPWSGDVVLYHAMPHGLRDGLRRRIRPGLFVNVGAVLAIKRDMLSQHHTQKEWLDVSQGMDSYLSEMENMARQVGAMSQRFEFAEGWRRHSHLGFATADADPLRDTLGDACWVDPVYEQSLEQ